MKLVSGLQKGRRLKKPEASTLRPTSSKVREALFAILRDRVRQATVIDLYAGTGALGLEALSRGARHVMFVDQAPASLHILRANILRCGVQDNSFVIGQEVKRFLRTRSAGNTTEPFDLILADPPYHTGEADAVLELLGSSRILSSSGIVVIEHASKYQPPQHSGNLGQFRQARYGDTTLTFYAQMPPAPGLSCV